MKKYVQFLTTNLKGKVTDAIGSDGYLPLDGRTGLARDIQSAHEQLRRMQKFKKHFVGFAIHYGDLKTSREVYYWIDEQLA